MYLPPLAYFPVRCTLSNSLQQYCHPPSSLLSSLSLSEPQIQKMRRVQVLYVSVRADCFPGPTTLRRVLSQKGRPLPRHRQRWHDLRSLWLLVAPGGVVTMLRGKFGQIGKDLGDGHVTMDAFQQAR